MGGFLDTLPIPGHPKTTADVLLRSGQVDDAGKLAVRSVKSVEVPIEFLQWSVTQDLQVLHIHDVKAVMLRVDLIHHGGQITVNPLEVGGLWKPAGSAGAGTVIDHSPILGHDRRPLHADDLGIADNHLALRAGQDLRDRDRREDLLLERLFLICSVHSLSPFTYASNALRKA